MRQQWSLRERLLRLRHSSPAIRAAPIPRNTTLGAQLSLVAFLLFVLTAYIQAGIATSPQASGSGDIRINEFMASNRGAVLDEKGGTPDWLELYNAGSSDVSIEGWALSNGAGRKWNFPAGSVLPAGGYLLIYAAGEGSAADPTDPTTGAPLRASFKLSAAGGKLVLLRPDSSVASTVGPDLPRQLPNTSFGVPAPWEEPGTTPVIAPMTFLAEATPGAPNSAPMALGPFILNISRTATPLRPPAGVDVVVNITMEPNLYDIDESKVVLSYIVNLGEEQNVAATKLASGPGQLVVFSAAIPHTSFAAGDVLRWRATAADTAGYISTFPGPPEEEGAAGGSPSTRYLGTAVELAEADVITKEVPILEWLSPDPAAATTQEGAGEQVVFFNGRLHDNAFVRRRGVTALGWPKPKLKFELPDQTFKYADDLPPVSEFGLQSFWYELGERSYMKETLALKFMRNAGVIAPESFHLHVRLNGKFYGLFAFVEIIDPDYLKRYGLPPSGLLFKSVSGELSNLRWDLPVKDMPGFWEKENRRKHGRDWEQLASFSRGLAGGGPVPRSKFVFDAVNLPQVVNNMAAQTIVNNMDRCTKNFFMYQHPITREWYMLPWDMDGSFGQDNGLGGKPGPNYCVLACEQWNSPFYCDSEHPQDISRTTPWGTISVTLTGSYTGPAVRKLMQSASEARAARRRANSSSNSVLMGGTNPMYAAGNPITTFPVPRGWQDPDRSTVNVASPNGPEGTYNHLYDAILDVNATRSMYMRRLRTLSDEYLGAGKIAEFAKEMYDRIKPLADLDAKTWTSGINIDKGYKQITTEFLPIRKDQLLGPLYGPGGRRPLLPEGQPNGVSLKLARYSYDTAAPDAAFVQISNPNQIAVDVSEWRLVGAATFTFPAGAVVPSGSTAYVAADKAVFRSRNAGPQGGMGLLVLGPLKVQQTKGTADTSVVQLLSGNGTVVHELKGGGVRK